ncbi:MAG: hypothetical protein WBE97_10935 [Candidatus Acidiferrales bacterium]
MSALGLAVLAPLGLVFETLVGEKHLFAGGENKLGTALAALQDLIVIFHALPPGSRDLENPQLPHRQPGNAGIRRDYLRFQLSP